MSRSNVFGWIVFFATSFALGTPALAAEDPMTSGDQNTEETPRVDDASMAEKDRDGGLDSKARRLLKNEQERGANAVERVRSADYTLGYHLVADDAASDQVAGGFNVTAGSLEGTQLAAGFNIAGQSLRGAQVAPVFNVLGADLSGVQFAGAFNSASGNLRGGQIAGALNANRGPVTGLQLAGGINIATGDVTGVQLAAFNIATGPVEGTQLGVVNIAPSAEVGVGLFNIYWDGELEAEVYGADDALMMVGIRHGGKRVYNVYHVGTRYNDEPELPLAYGMGLGWRTGYGRSAEFSMDVTGTSIIGENQSWSWKDQTNLFKFRPLLTLRPTETLAFFGGPTATLMVNARSTDADDYAYFNAWQLATVEDGAEVAIWPGFTFGVRMF